MANAPDDVPADVDLSVALVEALVREQHPDLADRVSPFAEGWDNAVYRLGDDSLVRVPRRELGRANLLLELRFLPLLPDVGLRVPVPVREGRPGLGYPYPWSIVPFLEGQVVDVHPVQAKELLGFFHALHRPGPEELPRRASRSMPLQERDLQVRERLAVFEPVTAAALATIWDQALAAPRHDGPPLWVHGDLHPFNLLRQADRLVAVLDWGDQFAGDPAPDLAAVWMLLDPAEHAPFRAIDEARWQRGRGWAVYYAAMLVYAANKGASEGFRRVGALTAARLTIAGSPR